MNKVGPSGPLLSGAISVCERSAGLSFCLSLSFFCLGGKVSDEQFHW